MRGRLDLPSGAPLRIVAWVPEGTVGPTAAQTPEQPDQPPAGALEDTMADQWRVNAFSVELGNMP
ncbi:MAG TPA: hypothetical protein VE173_16595, partial [Longimicrobiales bacterium]|nr:hypothetical protein [Longimicrobiales bacterium]